MLASPQSWNFVPTTVFLHRSTEPTFPSRRIFQRSFRHGAGILSRLGANSHSVTITCSHAMTSGVIPPARLLSALLLLRFLLIVSRQAASAGDTVLPLIMQTMFNLRIYGTLTKTPLLAARLNIDGIVISPALKNVSASASYPPLFTPSAVGK